MYFDPQDRDKALQAVSDLTAESRQANSTYRETIAKSCVTVITALVAIVGFFINSHQAKLLFSPSDASPTLYVALISFGISYALITSSTKYYSNWLGQHAESIRQIGLENKNTSDLHKTLSSEEGRRLARTTHASEFFALIGIICLIIFSVTLMSNAKNSYLMPDARSAQSNHSR
jgi:uncharacterized membrane protein